MWILKCDACSKEQVVEADILGRVTVPLGWKPKIGRHACSDKCLKKLKPRNMAEKIDYEVIDELKGIELTDDGKFDDDDDECEVCEGSGCSPEDYPYPVDCAACDGTGRE